MRLNNPEVRIENSSCCNAHCTVCPREQLTRPRMVMDLVPFSRLVRQAKDLGATVIAIYGFGEPLLDTGIADKVKVCSDHGLESFITTNAFKLWKKRTFELLDAGLTHIRFSVHGINKQMYESVHKGLRYPFVKNNIDLFLSMNRDVYNGQCVTMLTAMPMHDEPIELIREKWEDAVDFLEIWSPHNWAGGKDFRKIVRKKKTCGRPWDGPVQINSDGTMMVCCFDFNGEMTVGDTNRQSIKKILKGAEFDRIRGKHESGDLAGLPCKTCDQLNEYEESPLLYSNRDKSRAINKSSTTKIKIGG